jgi:hypothetical protein
MRDLTAGELHLFWRSNLALIYDMPHPCEYMIRISRDKIPWIPTKNFEVLTLHPATPSSTTPGLLLVGRSFGSHGCRQISFPFKFAPQKIDADSELISDRKGNSEIIASRMRAGIQDGGLASRMRSALSHHL